MRDPLPSALPSSADSLPAPRCSASADRPAQTRIAEKGQRRSPGHRGDPTDRRCPTCPEGQPKLKKRPRTPARVPPHRGGLRFAGCRRREVKQSWTHSLITGRSSKPRETPPRGYSRPNSAAHRSARRRLSSIDTPFQIIHTENYAHSSRDVPADDPHSTPRFFCHISPPRPAPAHPRPRRRARARGPALGQQRRFSTEQCIAGMNAAACRSARFAGIPHSAPPHPHPHPNLRVLCRSHLLLWLF